MIKEQKLKELIEKEATIFHYICEYGIIEEFNLKGCEIYNDFDSTQLVYENEPYDLKNLFETKAEAEFEAEFGNVEKVVKMPVPPTWEEFIIGKDFYCCKGLYISMDDIIELVDSRLRYSEEIVLTLPNTKENYIKALDKMKELWREE